RSSYADTKKWVPRPLQERVRARAEDRLHGIQNILNHPKHTGHVGDVAPTYGKFADLQEISAISDRDWPIQAPTPAAAVADRTIVNLFEPVLKGVRGWIRGTGHGHETYCFKLVLGGEGGKGHSIGFDFRPASRPPEIIHLFDPNKGEYEFGIDGYPQGTLFAF